MSSDKKIKKIFEKEGDELIRSKKEKILSDDFLNSVKSLPFKNNKKRYILKPALAVAMMLLVVCGLVLAIPFFTRNQTTITPPDTSSNSITPPDTSKDSITPPDTSEIIDHPPAELATWYWCSMEPYAIIEIEEITDDVVTSYEYEYVKIKCKIVDSFNTSRFNSDPSFDGSGMKYVPFEEIEEIYVTKRSVDRFENEKTVLIYVERIINGRYYYGPRVNDDGVSEFFSIVDGRLQLKEDDYNAFSFLPLEELNDALGSHWGKESNVKKAIPKKKIGSGMTIDEIIEYFNAWDEARRIFNLEWDHTIPI